MSPSLLTGAVRRARDEQKAEQAGASRDRFLGERGDDLRRRASLVVADYRCGSPTMGRCRLCERRLKAAISSGGSGRARHWLAFLLKICSVSQPCICARAIAKGRPPATDIWAPRRGIQR